MMKTIVFSGDSHTCGEGATGYSRVDHVMLGYDPKGKGIGRYILPDTQCYVNLVRRFVNDATVSASSLRRCRALSAETGSPVEYNCIPLRKRITLAIAAELAILQFAEKKTPARVNIYLDQTLYRTVDLCAPVTRFGDWSFRNISVSCHGARSLCLEVVEGEAWLSALETFGGEWAVVASGVGSCDSERYCREYFAEGVTEFSPAIVVAEMHTINDWLCGISEKEYKKRIHTLITSIENIGATPIMLSVAPIVGEQDGYEELIAAAAEAVREHGVPFADAHAAFEKKLCGMTEEQRREAMYSDRWHVNNTGHRIYAETIRNVLRKYLQ